MPAPPRRPTATSKTPGGTTTQSTATSKTSKIPTLGDPFAELISEPVKTGKFLMFFSEPGGGKTSLAAQFPESLFVITSNEQGIRQLQERGIVNPKLPVIDLDPLYNEDEIPVGKGHPGWIKAVSIASMFAEGNHPYKTIVYDTTSGLEGLCLQHCASIQFNSDMQSRTQDSWNHYANGPRKAAQTYWESQFLNKCVEATTKGLNVILLAHSAIKTVENPNGPDYEIIQPQLNNSTWSYTSKALQGVFFLGKKRTFTTDPKTKKISVSGLSRFIGVETSTWYTAKNWYNLHDEIPAGESPAQSYANFTKAVGM